jgi:uncharacterized Rmd1/YagE family protein
MNNQPQIQAQPQAQPQVQGQVQPQVQQQVQPQASKRRRVHAFLLSDRIDTANLEHDGVISTTPLTYKFADGFVTLFRYGVAVTLCLSPEDEQHVLRTLEPRLVRPITPPEEETLLIEQAPDKEDQILPGGPMLLKTITPEHLVVIADALSKSVVLARDEREVAGVFDVVEPFARQLAEKGRLYGGRRTILRHIGNALLVQHRLSGRVAVTEKPDVVWDRQDLDRLYARLEDEYELKERAEALSRKLAVIADTAEILTDTIDTRRSLRLEVIIVILIAVELAVAAFQVLYSIS